ncbi:MAG: radical SAM protein [Candidatus Jordarchaeales archaeon]
MKKNLAEILEKAIQKPLTAGEAERLLAERGHIDDLLRVAREVTEEQGGRVLKVYAPSKRFPPISVTGGRCELNCAHCGGHYLSHMIPAETPERLYEVCVGLYEKGAVGCLISGGSTSGGYVPLGPFIGAIRRVKAETGLILNVHTGLVDDVLARQLAEAGVDVVSLDVVGDTETVRAVYGLDRRAEDYFEALHRHVKAGLKHVVPHICVGLHYGELRGELKALEAVKSVKPKKLVFIVLTPTKGTRMEGVAPPSPLDVVKVMAVARLVMKDTKIILGCMRPAGRVREKLDVLALDVVDGIVLPVREAVREAERRGFAVEKLESCCAIPQELEVAASRKGY